MKTTKEVNFINSHLPSGRGAFGFSSPAKTQKASKPIKNRVGKAVVRMYFFIILFIIITPFKPLELCEVSHKLY